MNKTRLNRRMILAVACGIGLCTMGTSILEAQDVRIKALVGPENSLSDHQIGDQIEPDEVVVAGENSIVVLKGSWGNCQGWLIVSNSRASFGRTRPTPCESERTGPEILSDALSNKSLAEHALAIAGGKAEGFSNPPDWIDELEAELTALSQTNSQPAPSGFGQLTVVSKFAGKGILYMEGPSGGSGGQGFSHSSKIPRESPRVKQISIRSGAWIDGINVGFLLPNGTYQYGDWAGGNGGMPRTFDLMDGEYIAGISGTYDRFVNQIRFHTNRRQSPMYGTQPGKISFHYTAPPNCAIVGFHGSAGQYVDSIGVFLWCTAS